MNKREQEWLLKEKYAGIPSPAYKDDLVKLEQGTPLAYLIGWCQFLEARIDLAHRPLIPRTETEFWVEKLSATMRGDEHMLDLCAGSGCIGIALKLRHPRCTLTSADFDPSALQSVEMNLSINKIGGTTVVLSDLFEHVNGVFDLIVANPPYIDPNRIHEVDSAVREHEPHQALFAPHGTSIIKRIIADAREHLSSHGKVVIEFGIDQSKELTQYAKQYYEVVEVELDQYGIPRTLHLSRKK